MTPTDVALMAEGLSLDDLEKLIADQERLVRARIDANCYLDGAGDRLEVLREVVAVKRVEEEG